jgi:hypothetical protein
VIDRNAVKGAMSMDTPKCTGAIVIGCVLALAVIRYVFEGKS